MEFKEYKGPSAFGEYWYIGLSTAQKPVKNIPLFAKLFEIDTQRTYAWDRYRWALETTPNHYASKTTIDLNQAAGDYELFESGALALEIISLGLLIPADLTGETIFTGLSVQSTDTPAVEFITAAEGDVANLEAGTFLWFTGNGIMGAREKIELTIYGGPTADTQIAQVFLSYIPGRL